MIYQWQGDESCQEKAKHLYKDFQSRNMFIPVVFPDFKNDWDNSKLSMKWLDKFGNSINTEDSLQWMDSVLDAAIVKIPDLSLNNDESRSRRHRIKDIMNDDETKSH